MIEISKSVKAPPGINGMISPLLIPPPNINGKPN
jgi:hypothetical protein